MKVVCPKCGSENISGNKKGFSAGKAVACAVLTGGVGLLAGFHGSGTVEGYCLACGHKWNVKQLAEQQKRTEDVKKIEEHSEWKRKFYSAYLEGYIDLAAEIYSNKFPFDKETPDVHAGYKRQRKIEKEIKIIVGVLVGIACIVLLVIIIANY